MESDNFKFATIENTGCKLIAPSLILMNQTDRPSLKNTSTQTETNNCPEKPYNCSICGKNYTTPYILKRHRNTIHASKSVEGSKENLQKKNLNINLSKQSPKFELGPHKVKPKLKH